MRTTKWIISILAVILFSSLAFSFQNEPKNFRGFKWGTSIKDIKGLKPVYENGSIVKNLYVKLNEKLKIGKADVEQIYYHFKDDELSGITITMSGLSNYEIIKNIFFQNYGTPTSGVEKDKDYEWHGEDASIALFYNKDKDTGFALYVSTLPTTKEYFESLKPVEGAEDL